MDYVPQYDEQGNLTGICCRNMSIPLPPGNSDTSQFLVWLQSQNMTQEQWLAANPWSPWGNLSLADYQAQRTAQLKSDCDTLVLSCYPQTNQTAMVVMLMQATQQGLSNRAAYLEKVWTWATAITGLYYQQAAMIQACATQAQVQAISWDEALSSLEAQDPLVTIQQAMSITT